MNMKNYPILHLDTNKNKRTAILYLLFIKLLTFHVKA
jgi:hypothetical protein